MNISKFEALSSFNPNSVLAEYNMTTRDLDNMVNILSTYDIDDTFKRELISTKERGYRDLRKWKLDNYIKRYTSLKDLISDYTTLDDYMLELSEQGFKVELHLRGAFNKFMNINCGINIDKLALVSNYLNHLNKTNRVKLELVGIDSLDRTNIISIRVDVQSIN